MIRVSTAGIHLSVLVTILAFANAADAFRTSAIAGVRNIQRWTTPVGAASSSIGNIVKGNKILASGRIVECRGGSSYLVQIENSETTVHCELAGSLYRRRKFMALNTKVKIEVHLLAPKKGRIVERIDSYEQLILQRSENKAGQPGNKQVAKQGDSDSSDSEYDDSDVEEV
ncbi:translation initiation factor IF-1, putative [Babesia ovata]|uniref:Translation initiation factor IF-1, putative n=1 Tax=Babesia ovata TaxID=189622 RepID=A0A2H6KAC4_9APIC|nr:translation initiation factor IF-1, putative [Babesia ovata]GBE59935.1 translation initiation factor IF-1, putative [Babesia ovata]